MTPKILVRCSGCGDVQVSVRRIRLRMLAATGEAAIVFRCPSCDEVIVRTLNGDGVRVLLAIDQVSATLCLSRAELVAVQDTRGSLRRCKLSSEDGQRRRGWARVRRRTA